MEEPKILQVTYGAFSCTLEGFEDPVETLMAVAEYFRGLASENPGFAGVGGVPDPAEMARQIRAAGAGAVDVRIEAAEPGMAAAGDMSATTTSDEGEGQEPEEVSAGSAREAPAADRAADRPEPRQFVEAPSLADREPEAVPPRAHGRGGEEEDRERPGTSDTPSPEASSEARRLLSTSPDEEALLRILSRAESQLSDPEAARRREAMAHVKAAVAATQAGRALGDVSPAAEEAAPFREDLEAVARPPLAEERPAPPPLRLVASQRVDLPRMKAALSGRRPLPMGEKPLAESPAPPVARPPAGPLPPSAPNPASGSFAEFAAGAGATALPDLLEAAAAWLVRDGDEGGACRTRLLEIAGECMGREPSREEALRVFGTLLREGRLERAGNGRFRPGPLSRLDPARMAG